MANMSYCRFNNTAQALQDCLNATENNELHDLADYEYRGIEDILELCEAMLDYREQLEEAINNKNK